MKLIADDMIRQDGNDGERSPAIKSEDVALVLSGHFARFWPGEQ